MTYQDLLAQRNALNAQIEAARVIERAAVVAQIRDLMALYDLTLDDVTAAQQRAQAAFPATKITVALPARYQDPKTGKTWSGKGRAPAWLGRDREKFRIAAQG